LIYQFGLVRECRSHAERFGAGLSGQTHSAPPASVVVTATAAKQDDQNDDHDDQCGSAHDSPLLFGTAGIAFFKKMRLMNQCQNPMYGPHIHRDLEHFSCQYISVYFLITYKLQFVFSIGAFDHNEAHSPSI
jgi:hypothetical protein